MTDEARTGESRSESDELAEAVEAFAELASAFQEAEKAIDSALDEGVPVAGEGLGADLDGEEEVEEALEDIFAQFEAETGDEHDEDADEMDGATTLAIRPRPVEHRRTDQVVSNLVRVLTSKREVSKRDLEIVFEITKSKLVEAVNAEAITVFLREGEHIRFAHIAYSKELYRGNPKEERRFKALIEKLKQTKLPAGTGIVGKVMDDNVPYITLDARRDRHYFEGIQKSTGFPVHSMMTVPIAYEGKNYGAIQLLNKSPTSGEQFFSQRDLRLAEEVADYSARAIFMANNPGHAWPPEDLARYIARLARVEYVDLDEVPLDEKLLQVVGEENLSKFRILPIKKLGTRTIKAAMDNPLDLARRDGFQLATDLEVEVLVVAPPDQIKRAIDKAFPKGEVNDVKEAFIADLRERMGTSTEKVELATDAREDSAPVIKLVNQLIEDAYARGASDIHIEPFEKEVLVRYRTDGVLHEVVRLPKDAIRSLTARLKIMAELDISEQRLPQDGRIRFKDYSRSGLDVDLRVATGPMIWGEKTVMRILDKSAATVGIDKLGYSEHNLKLYLECVEAPYGMILHTGPTGSGKTTSLYAALDYCNEPDFNIQTAEDPVEYVMHGINQMQMRPGIGLTFARALKCYLRQDPDIILVGEIRDLETASIAIEAALTGHQVFSTLHTNDAAGTVTRLVEMGVEPFLITGALLCVCAQRLMRRLCATCKVPQEVGDAERDLLKAAPEEEPAIFTTREGGCPRCNEVGYKGRLGTHELLVMNEAVRTIAARHAVTASEIHKVAVEEGGLIPLFDDAMAKVREGLTDIAEALRNVSQA